MGIPLQVVKANDDISYFYIAYQAFLLVSTFIGPGSIVLMLVGAFSLAFNMSDTNSLIFNLVLVGIFVFACIFMKSDHQIMIAQLLTLLYAVIMIAVYIGIFIQIANMGPLALTSLMTFFTFGSYIVAALLHPQVHSTQLCSFVSSGNSFRSSGASSHSLFTSAPSHQCKAIKLTLSLNFSCRQMFFSSGTCFLSSTPCSTWTMSRGEPGRFQSLLRTSLLRQKTRFGTLRHGLKIDSFPKLLSNSFCSRQRKQAKLQAQRKTEVFWVTSR